MRERVSGDTLALLAAAVLKEAGPLRKVELSREAAAAWRRGDLVIGAADAPARPARPARPLLRPPREMKKRRNFGSLPGRVALLHALAHIELNAIDLAWDIVARFAAPELPRAFYDDWVAVAAEEAEHFALLSARLAALGSWYGDLPAHDGLWEAAATTAHDLVARLAVVPLVLEARGLDVTPDMMVRLERAGDTESAAILTRIYNDEIGHVAVGARWFEWVCRDQALDPEITFHDRVRRYFTGLLKPPFNSEARDRAGFPAAYYAPLAASSRKEQAMRRGLALAVALFLGLVSGASAETTTLRIIRPLDLVALPLLVMEHEHLIERTAEAMNLGNIKVTWSAPGSAPTNPNSTVELSNGEADLFTIDLVPFLLAADATAGTPAELRGVGAIAQRPYVLVTRNDAIRTIRDFAAADRIAVPDPKSSGPAVMLEMAAAQEWGVEHYRKLDPLMLARADEAAATMLMSGKGDISAHFSRTPFADSELGDLKIHRVMDSFDIAGPHSAAVLATTSQFRVANPVLSGAILSALQQADDLIKSTPGTAAEIFTAMVKDQDIPLEDLTDMIGDPDLAYSAAPIGLMRLVDFLRRTGRLKRRPGKWQELFLPEARDLPGN